MQDKDIITVLQTTEDGRALSKHWTWDGEKFQSKAWPNALWFRATPCGVGSLDELAILLKTVAKDSRACIIRGVPVKDVDPATDKVRRTCREDEKKKAYFVGQENGMHWLCVDVDGVPTDIDPVVDPVGYVSAARELLGGELAQGRCFAQLSSSVGVKHGQFRAHLWYWLTEPAHDAALKEWAKGADQRLKEWASEQDDERLKEWGALGVQGKAGIGGIDHALYSPVQVHYVATPTFVGAPDPIADRFIWLDGNETVWPNGLLTIPEWKKREEERVAAHQAKVAAKKALRAQRIEQAEARGEVYVDDNSWVHEALAHIHPDSLGYSEWVNVGMALHSEGFDVHVWDDWSSGGETYEHGQCLEKWQSFGMGAGGVGLGTIHHLATSYGWSDPRKRTKRSKKGVKMAGKQLKVLEPGEKKERAQGVYYLNSTTDTALANWWFEYATVDGCEPRVLGGELFMADPNTKMWKKRGDLATHLTRFDGKCFIFNPEGDDYEVKVGRRFAEAAAKTVIGLAAESTEEVGNALAIGESVVYLDRKAKNMVCTPLTVAHGATSRIDVDVTTPEARAAIASPTMPLSDSAPMLKHYFSTTWVEDGCRIRAAEILGAALLGLGPYAQKMWWMVDGGEAAIDGEGGTGKSTYFQLLDGLVPSERQTTIHPADFQCEYRRAKLVGATLNIVYDAEDQDVMRAGYLRQIVHGEPTDAREPRQMPFTFVPLALHVIAANRLPDTPGAAKATWDRFEVLEFAERYRDTDGELADLGKIILADEFDALILLALWGAKRVCENKGYTPSAVGEARKQEWYGGSDPIKRFLAEMTVPVRGGASVREGIRASALYRAYTEWCKENGHKGICSSTRFGRTNGLPKNTSGGTTYYPVQLRPTM